MDKEVLSAMEQNLAAADGLTPVLLTRSADT